MEPKNILYLGMGSNIMYPLLIMPDLDNIYVIDEGDICFQRDRTFEGLKEDVCEILTRGDDKNSHSRGIYMNCLEKGNDTWYEYDHLEDELKECPQENHIHYLEGPSKILKNEDDGNIWRLDFIYDGKERHLVHYHGRNFLEEWPEEIQMVSHVICIGSFGWKYLSKSISDIVSQEEQETIVRMLDDRTTSSFIFTALAFNHLFFPEHYILKHGNHRNGDRLASYTVKYKTRNWHKKFMR